MLQKKEVNIIGNQKTSIREIKEKYGSFSKNELEQKNITLTAAGRIINRIRKFGDNLIFADLADQGGIIQLKVVQNENFAEVGTGDIIETTGIVCKTDKQDKQNNKSELSLEIKEFNILTKCQQSL